MMIRIFKGNNFISTSKTDSNITSINNICDVNNINNIDFPQDIAGANGGSDGRVVKGVKILGIDPIMQYLGCFKCSGRIQEDEDDSDPGHCTKCHLLQCIENWHQNVTAQMTIQGSNGVPLRLRAFTKVIYHMLRRNNHSPSHPR